MVTHSTLLGCTTHYCESWYFKKINVDVHCYVCTSYIIMKTSFIASLDNKIVDNVSILLWHWFYFLHHMYIVIRKICILDVSLAYHTRIHRQTVRHTYSNSSNWFALDSLWIMYGVAPLHAYPMWSCQQTYKFFIPIIKYHIIYISRLTVVSRAAK